MAQLRSRMADISESLLIENPVRYNADAYQPSSRLHDSRFGPYTPSDIFGSFPSRFRVHGWRQPSSDVLHHRDHPTLLLDLTAWRAQYTSNSHKPTLSTTSSLFLPQGFARSILSPAAPPHLPTRRHRLFSPLYLGFKT